MKYTEDLIKIIEAFGSIWPLLLTVFFIVVFIKKWTWIWSRLDNVKKIKVKKGDSEIEIETNNSLSSPKTVSDVNKDAQEEPNEAGLKVEKKTLFDVFMCLKDRKSEEAIKIFQSVQEQSEKGEIFENELIFLFYKHLSGYPNIIDEIQKKLDTDNLGSSDKYHIFLYLGQCYREIGDLDQMTDSFDKAISLSINEEKKVSATIQKSIGYKKDKNYDTASQLLITIYPTLDDKKNKVKVLRILSSIYKDKGDLILRIAYLEKALELIPNDIHTLFDLAFDLAASDFQHASINRYLSLLRYSPNHPDALNNVGSGFKELEMNHESVRYYEKAASENHYLAVGNLCFQYIKAGFIKEAQNLIDEHRKNGKIEQMIIRAQDEILNIKRTENKELDEVREKGEKTSNFFKSYSSHILDRRLVDTEYHSADWKNKSNSPVTVNIKLNHFEISWEEENRYSKGNNAFKIEGEIKEDKCEATFTFPQIYNYKTFSKFSKEKGVKSAIEEEIFDSIKGHCSLNIETGIIMFLGSDKDKEVLTFKLKSA